MENYGKKISRTIEDAINTTVCNVYEVGYHLSHMHRYLQQEFFKICLVYIHILAKNYEEGYYDDRNEYSCKKASEMVSHDEEWEKNFYKENIKKYCK